MGEVALILLLVIVLPLALILHYVTKWKTSRGLSKEEQKMLEDLWDSAQRMQSRINALETILDDEVKDWRKRT